MESVSENCSLDRLVELKDREYIGSERVSGKRAHGLVCERRCCWNGTTFLEFGHCEYNEDEPRLLYFIIRDTVKHTP